MTDKATLQIGDIEVKDFLSYEVDSNILTPADAFQCRLGGLTDGEIRKIKTGEKFILLVNGAVEMKGLIDKVTKSYDGSKREISIEGRDFMGLLVDSSVEEFVTLRDITLKDLTKKLLKNTPFIDKNNIQFSAEKKDMFGEPIKQGQPDVGQTIFEVLSGYAQRKGLIFWCNPGGQLVFGEPKKNGETEFSFYNYRDRVEANKYNNIIKATLTDDISKRYSVIIVVAQMQGSDIFGAGEHTVKKSKKDQGFPFHKPLILQASAESEKAAEIQAEWEIKKREAEGFKIELTVAGHSQNNQNYRANSICYIKDEILGLAGQFLAIGRKFIMDRGAGPKTELLIGRL